MFCLEDTTSFDFHSPQKGSYLLDIFASVHPSFEQCQKEEPVKYINICRFKINCRGLEKVHTIIHVSEFQVHVYSTYYSTYMRTYMYCTYSQFGVLAHGVVFLTWIIRSNRPHTGAKVLNELEKKVTCQPAHKHFSLFHFLTGTSASKKNHTFVLRRAFTPNRRFAATNKLHSCISDN